MELEDAEALEVAEVLSDIWFIKYHFVTLNDLIHSLCDFS